MWELHVTVAHHKTFILLKDSDYMAKMQRYMERWMESTTTDNVADDKLVVVAILRLKRC